MNAPPGFCGNTPTAEKLTVKQERAVPTAAGQDARRGPGLKPQVPSSPRAAVGVEATPGSMAARES